MQMLTGYRRKDGHYGIRNYVLVISTVHCANTVAAKIAAKTGCPVITHEHGCTDAHAVADRTVLALARAGQNPNVSGVLLVSLGCEQTSGAALKEQILEHTDRVELLSIQEAGGPPEAVAEGCRRVERLQQAAAEDCRSPMPFQELIVGVQCGGSDWTTALSGNTAIGNMTDRIVAAGGAVLMSEVHGFPGSEHIVAHHAVNRQVGMEILEMARELREEFIARSGHTIEEVNPTPGNKAGGITTLAEKSMGNVKKMGTAPVMGILKVGERVPGPGVWILDNRVEGPDSFNITGFALSCASAVVFSSGRGTPVGNAVMPILKLTGNPDRYEQIKSFFDFNAGVILRGASIEETGQALFETLLRKCCGEATRSEQNGDFEFTIPYGGT